VAFLVLWRGLVALGVTVVISGVVKARLAERTPMRRGGWHELSASELARGSLGRR
jgi:hypothetical protein